MTLDFCINFGFLLILFLFLILFPEKYTFNFIIPKHVIKMLGHNLGCYMLDMKNLCRVIARRAIYSLG